MRFFEAPDSHNEPTIWLDNSDRPLAVFSRWELSESTRHTWPHIVRALTAGPTLESARVVIDVLREEIAALTAANTDLNAELTSLRNCE